MSKRWIQSAIKRKGALTKKAQKAGKTVKGFITSYKGTDSRTLRQINLAKTLNKIRGGK
jgi:hypothetical protein